MGVVLVGVFGALSAPAQAQDSLSRGIDPVGFKLSPAMGGLLTLDGAIFFKPGSYHAGVGLDLNQGLMSFRLGDDRTGNLIKTRLDLHFFGAYAVTRFLDVGIDLPFTVLQTNGFQRLEDETGFVAKRPAAAGMGDVRIVARIQLFDEHHFPVSVAAIGEFRIPTGAEKSFLGGRGLLLSPRLVAEKTFWRKLRLVAQAGYRLRTAPGQYLNLYVGDELTFGAGGSFETPLDWPLPVPFPVLYAEVVVATPSRAPFTFDGSTSLKTSAELLVGGRTRLTDRLELTAGVGKGLGLRSGYGRTGIRVFAMVGYHDRKQPALFARKDSDGDGILDYQDLCPDVPGLPVYNGCPDTDADGIPDPDDRCPEIAGLAEHQGCVDTDGDGLADPDDGCPELIGPIEQRGCPDSDGDSVADDQDFCPDVAGPAELDGCPDKDGDGIPDVQDECPDEAGPPSTDGCPLLDEPLVIFEEGEFVIRGTILFDSGRASIKSQSFRLLDDTAQILEENPEVEKVYIDGHTDSAGKASTNLSLSQRRAQSVVEYLVKKGIAVRRLEARGFGEQRPIAENDTALGRAKNRRVEFTIEDEEMLEISPDETPAPPENAQ